MAGTGGSRTESRSPASTQEHFGAAVREPMLSAGQVDAVSGFSYLSAVNLRIAAFLPTILRCFDTRLWLRGLWVRGDRQSGIRCRPAPRR